MTEENYDYIKKLVNSSGHPVSIKASTNLQETGWDVRNSPRYVSKNKSDTLMEIDIVGRKESTLYAHANCELIIECKKQKAPWIFFTQTQRNDDPFTLNVNFAGFDEGYTSNSKENKLLFQRHFYYNRNSSTYFIVGGKKNGDSVETDDTLQNNDRKKSAFGGPGATIDRAISQVYHALQFYLSQGYNEVPEFYYPIIVFDGEMFEASYPHGELEIRPTNHVSLYFGVEFDKPELLETVKSLDLRLSKPYIVDIVKLNYFKQFLDEIEHKL
jgi:hypothetical protein